jgi:hypothetical protein
VADGSYVLLEPEELEDGALESTHTIDIEAFVPRNEIDEIYLDAPYYIFPDDEVGTEEDRGGEGLSRSGGIWRPQRLHRTAPKSGGKGKRLKRAS